VKPAARREAVQHLQVRYGFSERRACRVLSCNRKTAAHVSRRGDDELLRSRLRELAHQKVRWGYKMLWGTLRQEGWAVNHKKVYRLYKEEKLELRRKGKKRFKSELRGQPEFATTSNQLWTMDFVSDALSDGRSFRTLNLVDGFTRQCLAIETDTSLSGERVVSAW
jgi:putative transposase